MAPTKLKNNQTSTPKITIQPAINRIPPAKPDSSPLINPTPFSISTFKSGTPPIATYVVRPAQIWDSLTRYRECIIEDEPLEIHSDILLRRSTYRSHTGPWYARILEIRGLDPAHVYLRVFWYYTLDQLPAHVAVPRGGGEEARGGELVASNEMEVVSAQSVIRGVDIVHVHVGGNGGGEWENERMWWCTKYDFLKGKIVV